MVIAPLGEELFKPLGVVLMNYRRPGAARAFLWGVSGGAGFAIVEGLFNAAITLVGAYLILLALFMAFAIYYLTGKGRQSSGGRDP